MILRNVSCSIVMVLLLLAVGCTSPVLEVDVRVKLERAPALYEPVKVKVTVKARREVDGPVEAWLELPPTVAFINGQMHWRGDLAEGKSHTFEATVAFVAEGVSHISGMARYMPLGENRSMGIVGHGEWLRVTKIGGELRPSNLATSTPLSPQSEPSAPWNDPGQSYLPIDTPMDGSTLLNKLDQPRIFVIRSQSGIEELQQQGLVPADPWGRWDGKNYIFTGVLDRDFKDAEVFVALYDRLRPTTGYHFAIFRPQYELSRVVPEGTPLPTGPQLVFLNILSTEPKADWPVEQREVSPYQVRFIPYLDKDRAMELVVQVNSTEVGRYTVDPEAKSPSFKELTLSSFEAMKLP